MPMKVAKKFLAVGVSACLVAGTFTGALAVTAAGSSEPKVLFEENFDDLTALPEGWKEIKENTNGKVAQMGIFIPGRLGMDEGENVLSMVITGDYSGFMLFFFASGKCAKIPLSSYATKQNRRKLLKAYSDKEPLAMMLYQPEETELAIRTSASRMLLVGTAQIAAKTTRDSQGVAVVTLKKNQTIASVVPADTLELANPHRYRVRSLPATGALIRAEDEGEQMSLL